MRFSVSPTAAHRSALKEVPAAPVIAAMPDRVFLTVALGKNYIAAAAIDPIDSP